MIAVHCGAGKHSNKHHKDYNRLSNKACKKAIEIIQSGGSALEALKAAIVILENDPLTNAGLGSNLTTKGDVEMDASIMDGATLNFGGCGAVRRVKNPIKLAYSICKDQEGDMPFGLVPPMLLVDRGAVDYAKTNNIKLVKQDKLISLKASLQFKKYKKMLDECQDSLRLDTVGGVCVDLAGNVAAGCSSGGLILKTPGRVGQAALFGCGSYADCLNKQYEPSIAVSTTGCGEYLVHTQLAQQLANDLKSTNCPTTSVHKTMTDKFIKSPGLRNVDQKLGGALVLFVDRKKDEADILWGHSTDTMSVGYMRVHDDKPKSLISQLPNDSKVGESILVGGVYCCSSDLFKDSLIE